MKQDDFMVITFDADGGVGAMHRDEFSLGFLGPQRIERASEIKFNEETQLWDIYLPDPDGLVDIMGNKWFTERPGQGFASYDTARKFEVLWLEHCALQSIAALSVEGIELGARLRLPS